MRKLNLSFILVLMVSFAAVAGGLYFLHDFQMSRNSQAYVRAANRALKENRRDVALAHLRRYVLLAPKDPEGLIQFGTLLRAAGGDDQSYAMLDRALRIVPDRTEVRRDLVKIGMDLGRYSEVADHIRDYILKDSPNDGEALSQLSSCLIALGQYEEAETPLETSIEVAPAYLDSYVMLASLRHERLNRASDAMDAIDTMVTQNSDAALAYFNRAQWFAERMSELKSNRKKGSLDASEMGKQADLDIQQALKLDPDHANSRMLAIHLAYKGNRLDDIREHAEHGIKVSPEDHRFYIALAEVERIKKNSAKAFETLAQGVAAAPNNLPLKWALADLAIELEKHDEAVPIIEQLRDAKYQAELVTYLEAKQAVYKKDWLDAIKKIDEVRVNLRDRPDLLKNAEFWLGIAHRETLSPNQQLNSLRRAVALDPGFVQARLELAAALVNANLLSEAIAEYEQMLESPSAPVLAAIGLAKSLLAWNLSNPANWTDFDRILERMEGVASLQPQVAVLRMEKFLANDEFDKAKSVITEARKKYPDQFEQWQAEISLALRQKDWDDAAQLIESAQGQFGDTVQLRLLKARSVIQRQDPEMLAALSKISERNPAWSDKEFRQFLTGLAPLFARAGDHETARQMCLEVAAVEPRDLLIRLALLDIAVAAKKPEWMAKTLEELRDITGEKSMWHFGQALYLSLSGFDPKLEQESRQRWADALAHLKKAKATSPNWNRVPLLAGEINEYLGDVQAAADNYLEAIRLGERSSLVSGRTLSLLFKLRQFDAAATLIKQLKESQVSFTEEMHRAEVDVALELGRSRDALTATEDLVRDSQDAVDPVWLGQVYATLGKYEQAESQFRSAIEANKNDPKPWIGLVQVLVLAGKKDKVDAVIAQEEAALTGEDSSLTIGISYELVGKLEQARSVYQAAYDKTPDNLVMGHRLVDFLTKTGTSIQAESILRKMVKVANSLSEGKAEQLQFIEQKLARVLMGIGGQEQLGEALGIVERHLAANPDSLEDARLKAVILANTASSVQQQQAVAILEKLLSQNPTSQALSDDRFLLARLYVQAGERVKARNELKKLITTRKDDPRFYMAYAQLCLQSGEVTEAELYIGILQKLAPKDLSTAELEAQVLFRKERYAEVIRLLKGIGTGRSRDASKIDSAVTTKLWSAKTMEEFGRQLEQSGKLQEAAQFAAETEALYKQYIEERPEEMLALAEFLAQTSEIDRALDLFQEHGAKSTPIRIVSVAIAMMKNVQATPAQLSRLQTLIEANIQNHSASTLIALIAADLKSWRGQYREALNSYRAILERDSRNVPALNNLAVLNALTGGDWNESLELIQRGIDCGGPVHVLLDSRGIIHLAAGHPEKAITDFEGAVSQRETAERRFHVARAYLALKQVEAAKQAISRAVQLSLTEHQLHPLERPFLKELGDLLEEQPVKPVNAAVDR